MDPEKTQKYLEEVEEQAESILSDRHEIIDLDRRRNSNREAIRGLKNNKFSNQPNSKEWICIGNMFIKMPKKTATSFIEKGIFKVL